MIEKYNGQSTTKCDTCSRWKRTHVCFAAGSTTCTKCKAPKKCTNCKISQPRNMFTTNKRSPDGKHAWCKTCKNMASRMLKRKTAYTDKMMRAKITPALAEIERTTNHDISLLIMSGYSIETLTKAFITNETHAD